MELVKNYIAIPEEEIIQLREEIKTKYENNLKQYGVKKLSDNSCAMYQLIYLYRHIGKAVHKDVITRFVQEHFPDANSDQQVRHLGSQHGYNILNRNEVINNEKVPSGYNMLIDLEHPKSQFLNRKEKRKVALTTDDFKAIKKIWNNRCATCGAEEGKPHRVSGEIVKLQKGHINPNEALKEGNIIPQCQYCNRDYYKDLFIFNEDGYPYCINNPAFVLRSSDAVKRQIKELLKDY